MATVTGYTATKMQELADENVVGGNVTGGNLILAQRGGGTINAGNVIGPPGATGPQGPAGSGTTTICTSTTRPSSPTGGQTIFETDKLRWWMWTGSAWKWIQGNPPAVRLSGVSNQNIVPNVFTTLSFGTGTTHYDIDSLMHDEVTNNTRLTIPTGWGGIWQFGGGVHWALDAVGYSRAILICKNGLVTRGNRIAQFDSPAIPYGSIGGVQTIVGETLLSAGDYVELFVFHNSTTNPLQILNAGNVFPSLFWGRLVSQ